MRAKAARQAARFALSRIFCILHVMNAFVRRIQTVCAFVQLIHKERRFVMQNGTLDITLTYCAS